MTTSEFLSYLRRLDLQLWAEGDRLHINSPNGVLTPSLRAELAERKEEILAFIHTTKVAAHSSDLQLQPMPRGGDLPLSFSQQRLWFLNQMEPDSPVYIIPKAIRMSGVLDVEALHKTLDALVARHEVLRTNFTVQDGSPVQVIGESRPIEFPVIDLSERP